MHARPRFLLPSLMVTAFAIACTNEAVEPSPLLDPVPRTKAEEPARPWSPTKRAPIDPAQAQAEAAIAQVSFGLDPESLAALSAGRLLAEDFDGEPYMYLVFTSKRSEVRAPLSFVVSSTPEAGDTTTSVAALPERPAVGIAAAGHELLAAIQRTVAALGGPPALKRLVAASPGAFLLEANDGSYWDVDTSEQVPAGVLAEKRAEIAAAMAAPEAVEDAARRRAEWEAHLADAPEGAAPASSFASEGGDLDIGRAFTESGLAAVAASMRPLEIAPAKEGAILPQSVQGPVEENCRRYWFFGWHTSCDVVEYGRISVSSKQAHYPLQTRSFSLPRCVVGGVVSDVYQGCGPAAMTALVWRAWQDGAAFPALEGFDRVKGTTSPLTPYPFLRGASKTFENGMESVLGKTFAREMNTCTPGKAQGLTLPPGFETGANRWLKAQKVGLRLAHATSTIGFHRFDAARKARLLHRFVGVEERPVIALGDVGFLVAHYSPVARYRIVGPSSPFPGVWVEMIDRPGTWVNLHGTLQLTSALYWFEKI